LAKLAAKTEWFHFSGHGIYGLKDKCKNMSSFGKQELQKPSHTNIMAKITPRDLSLINNDLSYYLTT